MKASAKILMHGSETQKYYDILKEKLKARCKPTIDPNTVDTLMDMGYSRMKVLKALHLRKYEHSIQPMHKLFGYTKHHYTLTDKKIKRLCINPVPYNSTFISGNKLIKNIT